MTSILPRVGLALLIVALAVGCGLKNDLYLPEPDPRADDAEPETTRDADDETDA
jgi:predicted small lipoprotein YifL